MKELWKEISGFKKYKISNKGRVYSKISKRVIRTYIRTYKEKETEFAVLYRNKKRLHPQLHRIIAMAFIDNPKNKREVNHIDGNSSNNNIENLEWVSSSENTLHSYCTGLQKRGENFYSAKLSEKEAIEIINAYRLGVFSQSVISKAYGVSKSTIKDLLAGRNWAHLNIQDEIRIRRDRVYQYNSQNHNPKIYRERT